jgi:hypothetical protein
MWKPNSAAGRNPESRAKVSAARCGKPGPPEVVEAMRRRMTGVKLSDEIRRKMSEFHRRRGTRPPKAGRAWTVNENSLLGRFPAAQVAKRTGRTLTAVYMRRLELGPPDARRKH